MEKSLFSRDIPAPKILPCSILLVELKGKDLSSRCLHPHTSHTSGTEKDRRVEARIPVLPLLDSAVKHSLTSARPGFYARFTNKSFIKLQNRSPNYLSRKKARI